ncbi:MAG: aminotransferase class V-fold PLP-dependent enzyme [Subdoligranulum sp.]
MESDTIYADHAATTPLEPEVWEVMCYWLTKDFSNPAALYQSGIAAHQAVERARQSVAECLRCSASQIFFASGGSESNTWAILAVPAEQASVAEKSSLRLLNITQSVEHAHR